MATHPVAPLDVPHNVANKNSNSTASVSASSATTNGLTPLSIPHSISDQSAMSSPQRKHHGLGTAAERAASSAGSSPDSFKSFGDIVYPTITVNAHNSGGRDAPHSSMSPDPVRHVRTLPTWVHTRGEDEDDDITFPRLPPPLVRRQPGPSIYDAQREKTPVTPSAPSYGNHVGGGIVQASRWRGFVEGTALYPPAPPGTSSNSEKDNTDWLAQQPNLEGPWLASTQDPENGEEGSGDDQRELFGKKKRRIWYKRIHIMLLNSPMVPLTFRSIIWSLSLVALALAGSIFHMSMAYGVDQKASTVMAIVVDALALVYLIYITYDEYSGKPLGLRSPTVKIRLIMFDLVFIVFDSANLSLAFDSLFDVRWSCRSAVLFDEIASANGAIDPICDRQRALAAFLFLALCAWVSTFTVSVFRVVERVTSSR